MVGLIRRKRGFCRRQADNLHCLLLEVNGLLCICIRNMTDVHGVLDVFGDIIESKLSAFAHLEISQGDRAWRSPMFVLH